MHGVAFGLFSLVLSPVPIELERDVYAIETRQFRMPLRFDPDQIEKIHSLRLFVSEDRGKSWKHVKDYKTSAKMVSYSAPSDGFYWFALQFVFQDGSKEPGDLKDLEYVQKVYVNTERRTLKPDNSLEELQKEVQHMRMTIERLERRIAELESGNKRK